MAKRRKVMVALELPPVLYRALGELVGPRRLAKLTAEQREAITAVLQNASADVAAALELPSSAATVRDPKPSRGPG